MARSTRGGTSLGPGPIRTRVDGVEVAILADIRSC